MEQKTKTISIHAFIGGCGSANFKYLGPAISKVERQLHIQLDYRTLTGEQLRQDRWSAVQFAEWLAAGDIYLITDHATLAFQKIVSPYDQGDPWPPWDLDTVGDILHHHLHGHVGWPEDVRCPVHLQQKLVYKEAIKEISAPFLVLKRTIDGILTPEVRGHIFE